MQGWLLHATNISIQICWDTAIQERNSRFQTFEKLKNIHRLCRFNAKISSYFVALLNIVSKEST